MSSQKIEITKSPPSRSVISVSPHVQDRLLEQIILQSGGVGLGVLLAFAGSIFLAKYMGVGRLIAGAIDRVERGTDSLKEVSKSLADVVCDISEARRQNTVSHENILNKVETVIEKLSDMKEVLKDVHRKLEK